MSRICRGGIRISSANIVGPISEISAIRHKFHSEETLSPSKDSISISKEARDKSETHEILKDPLKNKNLESDEDIEKSFIYTQGS